MTTIASPHNPRLKALRRLQRRRERERSGAFPAEGEDLVAAAQRAGWPAIEGYRHTGSGLGGPGFHDVEPGALAAACTLASGTRVVGVYEQRWGPVLGPLCVYLHAVADPGNVGTTIRAAHAFGASCVALGPGCADPYGPRAVRASMGAIFFVALARLDEPVLEQLPGERVALDARAAAELRGPARAIAPQLTVLVGAERDGLPADLLGACEHRARIAIEGDSLNAAMAATVALYELTRRTSRVPAS